MRKRQATTGVGSAREAGYEVVRRPALITALRRALFLGSLDVVAQSALAHPLHGEQAPTVDMSDLRQVAPHILVAQDRRVPLVPNIGIISGEKAILVVDTGLGLANGERVYQAALRIANGRKIYLTTTHFHPEHSFGAMAFPGASLIMNAAQLDELREKGPAYLELFRGIGETARAALANTVPVNMAIAYRDRHVLDLGGTTVELSEVPAHTRGDQVIFVPQSRVLFTGDLAETGFFPVLIDKDSSGEKWIDVLGRLIAMRPAMIVPGHGEVTGKRLLDDVRDMLIWLRGQVRRGVRRNMPADAMVLEIAAAAKQRYPWWDNSQYLGYDIRSFKDEALAACKDNRRCRGRAPGTRASSL